ncbi:carboxymuconolactone decarboxylase family protein [bacterium]|nr:carboxymuconolactone decarboxylase family protein [bacterium]
MRKSIITLLCMLFVTLNARENVKDISTPDGQILQQFEARYGFVPKTLLVMSEREGVLPAFFQYGTSLMVGGPLTMREYNLVTLSAAVALKSPGCIANQIMKLKKLGVSDDEILQVVMVAGMLGNTTTLQDAFESLDSELDIMDPDE